MKLTTDRIALRLHNSNALTILDTGLQRRHSDISRMLVGRTFRDGDMLVPITTLPELTPTTVDRRPDGELVLPPDSQEVSHG